MRVRRPARVAWTDSVAMMSSASNPATDRRGMRSASSTSKIRLTWLRNSSGVFCRPALYSTYCSCRNVGSERSNATAMWVGCSSRRTLMSIEVKPYTALVGCPSVVEKFSTGNAKNAR